MHRPTNIPVALIRTTTSGRIRTAALLLLLLLSCSSCTDLALLPYRNQRLLRHYNYALGEKYLSVDGLKVCYQEMGRGENVLILPGLGTSIDFWQQNIPALARNYHVLALDVPGFGKSDKPDVPYTLDWLTEQVIRFLDAKGISRTAVIGGSLGGHEALLLALRRPQLVSKLVLMGSVGAWKRPGPLLSCALKTLWLDPAVVDYLRSHWPDIYPKLLRNDPPFAHDIFRYQMALRADGRAYWTKGRAASRALRNIFFASCRGRLRRVTCPVLLIWGQNDRIHPASEQGMYFRRHLPDSRLVVVPGAAHEVMADQPQIFNRLVLRFLASGTAAIDDRLPP